MNEVKLKDIELAETKLFSVEYEKTLQLDSIGDEKLRKIYKDSIDKPNPARTFRFTQLITQLKQQFTIYRTDVISASFRIQTAELSTAFGYIYSTWDTERNRFSTHHICYGSSLTSQDGEYRSRILPWKTFMRIFSIRKEIIDIVDEMIVAKLASGIIKYEVIIGYSSEFRHKDLFMRYIDSERLAIKLNILCWLYDYFNCVNGYEENHMNTTYKHILFDPADMPYYTRIIELIGAVDYQRMQHFELSSVNVKNVANSRSQPLKVGQKLFPLILGEFEHVDNIIFPTWREIYITNMCSNIALNYHSPSFCFIGDWYLVYNSQEGLYDNEAMLEKFKYSRVAHKITKRLRKANKYNFAEDDKTAISADFFRIATQISKAISFAEQNLNLSNFSLCMTSEFVGRTIRDNYKLYRKITPESRPIDASEYIFEEYDCFAKFVFELIYAFYCANVHSGVIHADPHSNNITIYKSYLGWKTRDNTLWKNPVDIYNIHGNAFAFEYTGEHTMLIDFSRAIIRDYEKIKNEFGKKNAMDYSRLQAEQFRRTIAHTLPEMWAKNQKELHEFIDLRFDDAFKVFSAIDAIIACSSILAIVRSEQMYAENKEMFKRVHMLLDGIASLAEKLVWEDFNACIRGEKPNDEWTNWRVIKHYFSEYIDTTLDSKEIITIYNFDSTDTNDINDYSRWGNLVNFEARKDIYVSDNTWGALTGKKAYDEFLREKNKMEGVNRMLYPEYQLPPKVESWMYL
jgi:hypothetical protein